MLVLAVDGTEPRTMAPAWPMRLPWGEWRPAMYAATGLLIFREMKPAAFSSCSPPTSPTTITASVPFVLEEFKDVGEVSQDNRIGAHTHNRTLSYLAFG